MYQTWAGKQEPGVLCIGVTGVPDAGLNRSEVTPGLMVGLAGRVAGVLGLEPKSGDGHAEGVTARQRKALSSSSCLEPARDGPLVQGRGPSGRGWPPWERQLSPKVVCSLPALQVRASPLGGDLG